MRVHKFKAWHREAKEMLHGTAAEIFTWQEQGQPIEILQYLDFADLNINEVCEADIILFTNWWFDGEVREDQLTGYIKYSTEQLAYVLTGVTNNKTFTDNADEISFKDLCAIVDGCDFEVIGNFYENPELLESQ